MHALALGPIVNLLASIMWSFLLPDIGVFRVGVIDKKVSDMWSSLQESYDACKTDKRLTSLTKGMLGTQYLPCLSCGAAQAKALITPMKHMVRKHYRAIAHDDHAIR